MTILSVWRTLLSDILCCLTFLAACMLWSFFVLMTWGDFSFCWYWWNCSPSLFQHYFHDINEVVFIFSLYNIQSQKCDLMLHYPCCLTFLAVWPSFLSDVHYCQTFSAAWHSLLSDFPCWKYISNLLATFPFVNIGGIVHHHCFNILFMILMKLFLFFHYIIFNHKSVIWCCK
jgi:hypothetical protein